MRGRGRVVDLLRTALMVFLVGALACAAERNPTTEAPGSPAPSPTPAGEAGVDSAREEDEEGAVGEGDPEALSPRREASRRVLIRGLEQLRAKRPRAAARSFERAIRLDPSHGHAYLRLAQARIELAEPEEARGLLERASEYLREDAAGAALADSLRDELP